MKFLKYWVINALEYFKHTLRFLFRCDEVVSISLLTDTKKSMYIEKEEVDKMLSGKLEIDFPNVSLIPIKVEYKELHGSGTMVQNSEGNLEFKFLSPTKIDLEQTIPAIGWIAGEIIHESEYYSLKARDLKGREWASEQILPNFSSGEGSTAELKLRELSYQHPHREMINSITFLQHEKILLPLNVVNKHVTIDTATKKETKDRVALEGARLSQDEMTVVVAYDKGHSSITYYDGNEITSSKVQNVWNAIKFITARTQSWNMAVSIEQGLKKYRIRSVLAEKKTRIGPPVAIQFNDMSCWDLFFDYVSYLNNNPDSNLPWYIESVISSGRSTLDIQAQTTTIAIESMLQDCFKDIAPVTDYSSDISMVKEIIDQNSSVDSSIRNRLIGFLNAMQEPRAKDYLEVLKNKHSVDGGFVKTYGRVRNKAAHGVSFTDTAQYLKDLGAVQTLFYQLIFLVIGYSGKFTDYSISGYPGGQFNASA